MYNIGNNIVLEVSKDGLYGYITILKDEDSEESDLKFYNQEETINEISRYIKYGLNINLIHSILDKPMYNEKICIANGKAPIHGKDGTIKYNFVMDKPLLPKLNEDGTVDYRELDSVNTVKEGQTLAIIIPPIEGEEGMRVTGERIPCIKGRMPKLKYGNNVELTPDGMKLIASSNGLVELKNGKVTVSKLLIVENVDNSTGNINFDGNVIVNKDILNGFTLKATGSIEVKGAVEGGEIISEGDVLVRQGIQGYNRLTINTNGNVSAKFIENSIINGRANITAEAIMHSTINSNGNIIVLGKKGLIVGGICRANFEIRARTIGSVMATTTIVEVGVNPDVKNRHDELDDKVKQNKENLGKIKQSIKVLETLKRSNRLDTKKQLLYNELNQAKLSLKMELNKLEKELMEYKFKINNLARGQIKVADIIYPGVKIVIGNSFLYIRDELKRCTFYKEDGDIRIGPY